MFLNVSFHFRSVRASTISSLSEWSSTSMVRASNETRSSLATANGESSSRPGLARMNSREKLPPRVASKQVGSRIAFNVENRIVHLHLPNQGAFASSRENVVSSKKKSVRASTMSRLTAAHVY